MSSEDAAGLPPIQLLEGAEYRYQLVGAASGFKLEPAEIFYPDDTEGLAGSLRPGLATGTVTLELRSESSLLGSNRIEVRSRKLDYLSHYRWMLRDIAEICTELLMERFSPSASWFAPEAARTPQSTYQQFAFLQSLIGSPEFTAAISRIIARPHVTWDVEEEFKVAQRGIKLTSDIQRQLFAPGPRQRWSGGVLDSLPLRIADRRTEATVNNAANQFIKFALRRWRDSCERVETALRTASGSQPVDRGLREAIYLGEQLDALLAEELFRDVGDMTLLPVDSQVLQKAPGYREVFRAFIQSEVASNLSWPGAEDVYGAGQRNIAALYEYWVFFRLAEIISDVCQKRIDLTSMIAASSDGLTVTLDRGSERKFDGQAQRLGRNLTLQLWFNKSFSHPGGSWTVAMRPDVSLFIDSASDPTFEPVWVHFDAKYRIDFIEEVLVSDLDNSDDETNSPSAFSSAVAKRDDLLKMHAYRDAIRRSAGAYVVYPGDERADRREYRELLPGLGAFALKPSETGEATGSASVGQFINDVLEHLASQMSQHERDRFWTKRIHDSAPYPDREAARFLFKPPADTNVLLGYVRSAQQLNWIHRTRKYNLRAGDRTGAVKKENVLAELLVLYGPSVNAPEIWTVASAAQLASAADLEATGYPQPGGKLYLCLDLIDPVAGYELSNDQVTQARARVAPPAIHGEPVSLTWAQLLA